MTFHLDIPESIASSLRLPGPEVEPRLRSELALALYAQGILPFGKASELAESSRYAFAGLVTSRNIPRHYTDAELAQDLDYARGQQYLADLQSGFHRSP
jgi:predicted HTH domain antitoxin